VWCSTGRSGIRSVPTIFGGLFWGYYSMDGRSINSLVVRLKCVWQMLRHLSCVLMAGVYNDIISLWFVIEIT